MQQLFKNLVGKKTFVKQLRKGEERKLEINGIINICLAVFFGKIEEKKREQSGFLFYSEKNFQH